MSDFPVLFPDSALSKVGGNEITVENGSATINAVNYPIVGLNLYGKSTQGYASHGGEPLGKNVIPHNVESKTINGITATVNEDKSITFAGTPTKSFEFVIYGNGYYGVPLSAGTYVISFGKEVHTGVSFTKGVLNKGGFGRDTSEETIEFSPSVDTYDSLRVAIQFTVGETYDETIYPMIRFADVTDDTYEPYKGTPNPDCPVPIESVGDDGNISVTACGKNLLNIRDDLPITVSGVTISRDNTGNIILNGTATATISFSLSTIDLPYNTYTMSIDSKIEGIGISCADFGSIFLTSTKNSVTIENSGSGNLRLNISPNIVLENFVLNPQIEIGSAATKYEPYKGNTAEITTGLPLCSVGDVRDELVYNADGTGKIIKRTHRMPLSSQYNWTMSANPARFGYAAGITGADTSSGYASAISEFFSDCRLYSTWVDVFTDYFADLDEFKEFLDNNDVYLIYPLATPEIIELSSAEMAALAELQTFEGVTNIFNDESAEMLVKVATNPLLSEFVKPVIDGLITRIENLEAATLSMGGNV